jgi:hypothetical protein
VIRTAVRIDARWRDEAPQPAHARRHRRVHPPRPSQQGIAIAKDVWMPGIGLGPPLDPDARAKKAAGL